MIPVNELLLFMLAALVLVISPGPNMIYLISRSVTQGRKAGIISLAGVIGGFLFHIILVSFGLSTFLFAIPFAFDVIKIFGIVYLLYLAYQAIKPNGKNVFETKDDTPVDRPRKLFITGFLTNVLNPKVALFYLSFFPQFIKPAYGSIITQALQLGVAQVIVSFAINLTIVLTAAKAASFFTKKPIWMKMQKWLMAGVLATLAIKMALTKSK